MHLMRQSLLFLRAMSAFLKSLTTILLMVLFILIL